jgi:VCBS repeat-containing protein
LEELERRELPSAGPTLLTLALTRPHGAGPGPTAVDGLVAAGPANVLVNDPGEDHGLSFPDNIQSETSVVLAGPNVVVAYNDVASLADNHVTSWSVSTDGAATFIDRGNLPTTPEGDAGDPVLAYDQARGLTYFATLMLSGTGIQVFRSSDNGRSFGPAVNAAPGNIAGDFLDKDWIAVDNFPGPGNGNVYLTYTQFPSFSFGPHGIYLSRSTDHGATWGPAGGLPLTPEGSLVQGSQVVVGPDHTVYAFWLDENAFFNDGGNLVLMMSKSTDFGVTFSTPTAVQTVNSQNVEGDLGLSSSNGFFRSNTFPQVVVNPANDNLYLVYDDVGTQSGDLADIFFTQSADGGTTWSAPVRVNNDVGLNDQWQPSLAVTPDGSKVGIFWYDRRFDVAHDDLIDRVGVIGTVSGGAVTFGQNFRVTDMSFPALPLDDDYMGDYDTAAADNQFFYTTWGDNRGGAAQGPDVRLAKIPVAGLPAQPPVAVDDSYVATPGFTLRIDQAHGVLANDVDVENDPFIAALQQTTAHGQLALRQNGSFTYRPARGFKGTDTFTYEAVDRDGHSAPATVTIRVNGKRPVARNDFYVTGGGVLIVPAARGVLANDSDPQHYPLTAELVKGPAHGQLILHPDGSFTYKPDKGSLGFDAFTYVAVDQSGVSQVATVVISALP